MKKILFCAFLFVSCFAYAGDRLKGDLHLHKKYLDQNQIEYNKKDLVDVEGFGECVIISNKEIMNMNPAVYSMLVKYLMLTN